MLEGVPDSSPTEPPSNPTHSGKIEVLPKVKPSYVEGALPEVATQSRRSSGSIQSFNGSKSRSSSNAITQMPVPVLVGVEEEMLFVEKAMKNGAVYLLGEAEVVAEPKYSLFKKMVVNYAYSFLRKNFGQGENILEIPHTRLLRVGMTYEI